MMRGPWQPPWRTAAEGEAPGVFETLQRGYDVLNTRPYLIAVPLALDLVVWLGPRLMSPALFTWLANLPGRYASGADLSASLRAEGAKTELIGGAARFWGIVGVPSVSGSLGREGLANAFGAPSANVGPWYVTLLMLLALGIVGLWLRTLFVVPLAQMVRREPFAVVATLRESVRTTLRVLALYAVGVAMLLLVLVPVGLLGFTLVLAGIDAIGWVLLAAFFPVSWVLFYGAFATNAIILDGVGPVRAAYRSYHVIRRSAWPTAGFIVASGLIAWAVPFALSRVAAQSVGVVPVMVAHAYIVAGLATASLLFYGERAGQVVEHSYAGAAQLSASRIKGE